jgi:mannose-6-phosphate isomerase-like protein (cupin superfamily)
MDKSGKYWGTTRSIFLQNNVEMHVMEINPGGYCSEHYHTMKFNRFVVLEGQLDVLTWKSGEKAEPDRVTLNPMDECTVKPGHFHKFENNSDKPCKALEIYWTELRADDIERRSIGGLSS